VSALNADDRDEVGIIAELEVHRYFDHYLTETFPKQMDRLFATHVVECPVAKKIDRVKWLTYGLLVACSAGATVTVEKLLKAVGLF
jgi:hypothetical protein